VQGNKMSVPYRELEGKQTFRRFGSFSALSVQNRPDVRFAGCMFSSDPFELWGGLRPLSFTLSTITSKVVVYAPAESADTLPPMCTPWFYRHNVLLQRNFSCFVLIKFVSMHPHSYEN
jgi:hypothetical protein